jgi:hypothetical protein
VTLLTGAGTGEYAAGRLIRDRIATAAPGLGADLSVAEGGSALWDVVRQQIPRLDLTSDDATLGRLGPVDLQVRLDDVRFGGAAPSLGGARAAVTVPLQSVADSIQAAVPSATVDGVSADPGTGTLEVLLGPGGLFQLTLRPSLTDGQVRVAAVSADVLGQAVSADRLAALTGGLNRRVQRSYPLGLRATSVRVGADALRVELTAGPGPLKRA